MTFCVAWAPRVPSYPYLSIAASFQFFPVYNSMLHVVLYVLCRVSVGMCTYQHMPPPKCFAVTCTGGPLADLVHTLVQFSIAHRQNQHPWMPGCRTIDMLRSPQERVEPVVASA